MKRLFQQVVLIAVAMLTAQSAMAEEWRINNDASKGAHFASINEAMASDEVKDGDVLYLDPGCLLSDEQTITKAVTVIGTGWASTMLYAPARLSGALNINAEGAKVLSLKITNQTFIRAKNVTVERCHMKNVVGCAANAIFIQCWLDCADSSNYRTVNGQSNSYWEFYNCIIHNDQSLSRYFAIGYVNNVKLVNNLIIGQLDNGIAVISAKNNIFIRGYYSQGPEVLNAGSLKFNCFSYDENTSYSGVTYAEAFPDNTFYDSVKLSDWIINSGVDGGKFQLCEGSPAIGAGEGGIDCGPYAEGSLYPFVTGGYPKHIPYFTETVVPARPTDGKVKVSLKIVNQNK